MCSFLAWAEGNPYYNIISFRKKARVAKARAKESRSNRNKIDTLKNRELARSHSCQLKHSRSMRLLTCNQNFNAHNQWEREWGISSLLCGKNVYRYIFLWRIHCTQREIEKYFFFGWVEVAWLLYCVDKTEPG